MEIDKIKFTAGLDGSIMCEILDSTGEPQDLSECTITFRLGYEYEDEPLILLPMEIIDNTKCLIKLKPEDTNILSIGEYEFQLIIIDRSNRKHGTEKVKISIDNIIE